MSGIKQNDLERIQDKLQLGQITLDGANIEIIKCERFRLIRSKIPMNIRKSLNKAVKDGILGHIKKDGYKPECYYFPPFKHMADDARIIEHNKMIDFKSSNSVIS